MSIRVSANELRKFIENTIGLKKLTSQNAKEYDIKKNEFAKANIDENNYLELDEIIDDDNLYEKFAALFAEDLEKQEQVKNAEQEKEETAVKDKSSSGV